jgi:radical SAM protein with 4Fe4S-binding SPASM domain
MAFSCPSESLSGFLTRLQRKANTNRLPLYGSFELTHRCSFRCQHCYLGDQHAIRQHQSEELDTDEVLSLLDQVIEAGTLFLTLTGGDPLIRKDFAEIYSHAVRGGLLVTVFCNGSLIDDAIISLWQKFPPRMVEVTMYGATAATCDEITQTKGSFDLFQQGIKRLQQNKIHYQLKTILLTNNQHELEQMETIAEELDVHFRYDAIVSPCMPYHDNHGRSNILSPPHVKRTGFPLQGLFPDNSTPPQNKQHMTDAMLAPLNLRLTADEIITINLANENRRRPFLTAHEQALPPEHNRLFVCGAGRTSYHVTPYGKLMPCVASIEPACNLRQHDFKQGWDGPLASLSQVEINEQSACYQCELRTRCDACPSVFSLETGDYQKPSPTLCSITKQRFIELQQYTNKEEFSC